MEKEFVPYEEAKALKKLGFNEPCFGLYNQIKELCYPQLNYGEWKSFHDQKDNRITPAPTFSQAFRWFRKNYPNLDFGVGKIYDGSNTNYHYHINLIWEYFVGTYEEAELACLKKLIEIVKTK